MGHFDMAIELRRLSLSPPPQQGIDVVIQGFEALGTDDRAVVATPSIDATIEVFNQLMLTATSMPPHDGAQPLSMTLHSCLTRFDEGFVTGRLLGRAHRVLSDVKSEKVKACFDSICAQGMDDLGFTGFEL
jgi:hypothetical protein